MMKTGDNNDENWGEKGKKYEEKESRVMNWNTILMSGADLQSCTPKVCVVSPCPYWRP